MQKKNVLHALTLLFLLIAASVMNAGSPPVLLHPEDQDDCIEKEVNFTWSQPDEAVRYRIEVARNAAFSNHVHDITGLTETVISLTLPAYNTLYFWRVSATFTDNSTAMSETAGFLTRYLPPELTSPEDGDKCQSGETAFDWESLADVIAYEFQVSESATFTEPIHYETNIAQSSYTWTLPQNGTDYYWRVKAIFANCESDWSEPNHLRSLSNPPELLMPDNLSVCVPTTPELSWTTDSFAQSYRLQVSEYENFSNTTVDVSQISSSSYTVSLPKKGTIYYWRVSSSFTQCTSGWSETYSFKTIEPEPVPMTPAQNEIGVPVDSYLSWYVGIPAQTYDLQIALDDSFSTTVTVLDVGGHNSNTFNLEAPLDNNDIFYWRVKAYYPNCETQWSSVYHFKTEYHSTTLLAPVDEETCVAINNEYHWKEVTGAQTYRIQIAEDESFENIAVEIEDIMGTSVYAEVPDELKTYYWRVRGDDGGNFGAWPPPNSFTSTIHKPRLADPDDGQAGVPRQTTIRWEQTQPGASYTVQVAADENFSNVLIEEEGLSGFTLDINLDGFNTNYWWRVKSMYNSCPSTWSEKRVFKTVLPPPNPVYPQNNAVKQPLNIGFIWQQEPTATKYSIQIATDPAFNNLFFSESGIEANSIIIGEFAEETTYYWRLNAINSEGVSEWSVVWQFTTGKKGPKTPDLISPPDESEQQPLTIVLVWSEVSSADNYHLQVSDKIDFANPIVDINNLTETSYTFTTTEYNKTFFWRVSASNEAGKSAWTDKWEFTTTEETVTDKVVLVSPNNNSDENPVDLEFTWESVDKATSYHFQLAEDQNFTQIVSEKQAVYDIKTYVLNLQPLTTYYWRVKAKNSISEGPWSDIWNFKTWDPSGVKNVPADYFNVNVYPNPFTNSTQISFKTATAENVRLSIKNALGQEIAVLKEGMLNAGSYNINWTPENLQSGVYWYSLQAGDKRVVNRIVFIK